MKKIKVDIVDKNVNDIDRLRGIGVHTNELLKRLRISEGLEVQVNSKVLDGFDIYHFPKFNPYFLNLPLVRKGKIVLTIHDLIPLIYKDKYPSGVRGKLIFLLNKLLLRKVDAIITISQTSKKDICRILKVKPEKVFVTYLAPREMFRKIEDQGFLEKISKKYNLPKDYVLYVGDVNYNKNLLSLAKACKEINKPLVIVGKQALNENLDINNVENKPFIDFLKEFRDDKKIIRLGFIETKDLVGIYNLAKVYCQPSFYEGFSLPIVEALACGVPVVASKIQTHVEIFEDNVFYADTKDSKDIGRKIKEVSENQKLRKDLIEKGLKKVKTFSWNKTAEETLKVYKSLF